MRKPALIQDLKTRGFDKKIQQAFEAIRREDFVPIELRDLAYNNEALPLADGATISQPYTIAFVLDLLALADGLKILEIGSGCGYTLALLNQLSKNSQIYGIEIIKALAIKSGEILKNYNNIKIIQGNGFRGVKEFSPYDRILISASADKLPEHLYGQLDNGGILVCPVRNSIWQVKKINNQIITKEFPGFMFVPLIKD